MAFYLIYRPRGERKVRRLLLGKYPDMGLAKARKKATGLRGDIVEGGDPVAQRKMDAEAAKRRAQDADAEARTIACRLTVKGLIDRFLHDKRDLRWLPRYRAMFEFNIIAPTRPELQLDLGDKAAADLTANDIDKLITAVQARGSEVQARRLYEALRAVLRFGVKKGLIAVNPLIAVTVPKNAEPRDRFLSVPELREVWKSLTAWDDGTEKCTVPVAAVRSLRLQLLLACRIGEITGMKKSEISDDGFWWTIPAERCKNGRAHTLPLPPAAREIIAAAIKASEHPQFVFPVHARDGSAWKALRPDVVSSHLGTLQEDFDFKDREGNPAPFVSHDLRRTAATYMRKAGVSSEVVSAILNHISEQKATVLGKHYDKDDLAFPMREALTRWQALLQDVAEGQDPFARNVEDITELEQRTIKRTQGARLVAISGGKS